MDVDSRGGAKTEANNEACSAEGGGVSDTGRICYGLTL